MCKQDPKLFLRWSFPSLPRGQILQQSPTPYSFPMKTNFTLSCHPIVVWCLSAVLLKKRLLKRFLVFPVFPSKSAPPIPRSKEKPSNILKPPAMRKNWQQKSRQVFSPRFQGNREPHFKTIITTPTMKTTTTEETITTTKTTRTIQMTSKNADSLYPCDSVVDPWQIVIVHLKPWF